MEGSEEDITSALDGTGESTPTEQEIRDCFAPYITLEVLPVLPTTPGGASTGTTDDTGEDEGESSADGGTSDDEGESED